jgi:ABC-type glycerol-3-phosphate transport system substrate-binding protein
MGMAWKGEWYPYGFSPFLQSFGGDILDRSTMTTAEGALNGPEAIAFGEWWQNLFTEGYVPGITQDSADRDTGFIDGKYALQWNGNWAGGLAKEKLGDDLLILPAPNFGNGARIGAGSWEFGVSANSENVEGATEFIEFMMQDEYLVQFSNVTGNIDFDILTKIFNRNLFVISAKHYKERESFFNEYKADMDADARKFFAAYLAFPYKSFLGRIILIIRYGFGIGGSKSKLIVKTILRRPIE